MEFLFILIALLGAIAAIGGFVYKKYSQGNIAEYQSYKESRKDLLGANDVSKLEGAIQRAKSQVTLGSFISRAGTGAMALSLTAAFLWGSFTYLKPSYNMYGTTIFGNEFSHVTHGWKFTGWGQHEIWKKNFTVATTSNKDTEASVVQPPYRVRMLDQVDGLLQTTVRFTLPDDPEQFATIAKKYRTQGNLLSSELVPPISETMNATASLMGAEEYYNGGRTEFAAEFNDMMRNGIYSLKRIERVQENLIKHKGTANATKGENQENYGENIKTVFEVEKQVDANGTPIRKPHNFRSLGITVDTAIVTDFDPNNEFDERMKLKQKASADRAIAREQRIQEEEQKLLAEARGQREVAEAQAAELKIQIQQTTKAETEKQLAITEATKAKESAEIAEDTAETNLRIGKLEAARIKVLADAEAYKKKELMEADGALDKKLEAYVTAQQVWAQAYANRKVPSIVMGGSEGAGANADASQFQAMLNAMLAKDLLVNPNATK